MDPAAGIVALVLAASSLLFSAAALIVGVRELGQLLPLAPRALDRPLLVVIPARNEAAGIAQTLRAVLRDPHPGLVVVVVDDRSNDDTAACADAVCARDARARVLRLTDDPPPGVFGKPRALAAGERGAAPEALDVLFLDADVTLADGALGALVHARRASGAAALSGVPRLQTATVVEALLVPTFVSLVTARFAPSRVHDARDRAAFLNGQLIVTDRAALHAVGGFDAVAHTVLEDVALARLLKARGGVLRLADARALASTRMYATFGAIVEGFSKNATALLGVRAGVDGVLAWAFACLPWAALVTALVAARAALPVVAPLAAGSLACAALARARAGVPWWPALVLPAAYGLVALVLVRASLRALARAPVVWKGRSYPRS